MRKSGEQVWYVCFLNTPHKRTILKHFGFWRRMRLLYRYYRHDYKKIKHPKERYLFSHVCCFQIKDDSAVILSQYRGGVWCELLKEGAIEFLEHMKASKRCDAVVKYKMYITREQALKMRGVGKNNCEDMVAKFLFLKHSGNTPLHLFHILCDNGGELIKGRKFYG